ncbi:MAG: response regulator [Candidatus Omnitrophica bacterium]|jgi:DNA-binding response OmpR family regulator|nr:response regulator [Candidatus Omnitrophota bacterium]
MKNSKKIIIVEDDPDINNLIAYNLRKASFNVEQVFDGLSAEQKLSNEYFDIVILDIMLPGIDGFDICRNLKENPFNGRNFIIMISAKSSQKDQLYAHILGADAYLTKPFSVAALMDIVKEVNQMQSQDFVVTHK